MSESRPPPARPLPDANATLPPETKPLQRPVTGPAMPVPRVATPPQPFAPVKPSQPGQPAQDGSRATPPAPSVKGPGTPIVTPAAPSQPFVPVVPPAPGSVTPPMGAPTPFQSQVVYPQTAPLPPVAPAAVPPAPGSAPRLGNTGTQPAMNAVAAAVPPVVTGPQPIRGSRITVQYPQVGTTLKSARGTYVVQDVLGTGEFGAVYECIGPFDQIYAVKMVRPANRPYSEVQAEWAREQARLFTLRHPNVVYIYDSFEQGHLFYLALERCDHPLKAMLGTPMQEGLVIELARQTLAAVAFLHDNDVVHDDLHGGNVLITHTDRPTVKISDFGISNELRGMPAVRPNVVHHAIMAPEILASGYTSRQSDLYQLGLLLYWMLTGEPAIQMDVPYQELVRQVAEGEPRKRAEAIGTPLGNLIAKMLRRREAFRFTSAREVWADLRELPAWKQRNLFPVK